MFYRHRQGYCLLYCTSKIGDTFEGIFVKQDAL